MVTSQCPCVPFTISFLHQNCIRCNSACFFSETNYFIFSKICHNFHTHKWNHGPMANCLMVNVKGHRSKQVQHFSKQMLTSHCWCFPCHIFSCPIHAISISTHCNIATITCPQQHFPLHNAIPCSQYNVHITMFTFTHNKCRPSSFLFYSVMFVRWEEPCAQSPNT